MNIPNGFKLVPVEPTNEMVAAIQDRITVTSRGGKIGCKAALREAIEVSTAPPQPIYDEEKERELFEACYRKEFEENSGNELSDADIQSMRDGPWYGESRHYLNGQWAGWKACAKSRDKSMEVGHA